MSHVTYDLQALKRKDPREQQEALEDILSHTEKRDQIALERRIANMEQRFGMSGEEFMVKWRGDEEIDIPGNEASEWEFLLRIVGQI